MAPMTPVSIVGAGPGDPSLISVRGLRYLTRADVIVHDTLIDPRLLRMARPDAERIDVGEAAPAEAAQDAICLLVAEKAREGKSVVRLKWGDPFVFDSGGKEALFLHEQGILFEVVPGIPALVGIPAYAGIPVTYPGSGDTLTFIRGFEHGEEATPDLDWHQLARWTARSCATRDRDSSHAWLPRCSHTGDPPTTRRRSSPAARRRSSGRCPARSRACRSSWMRIRRVRRRSSWWVRPQACAITSAGSTSGPCSARASSSPGRANRPASSWSG